MRERRVLGGLLLLVAGCGAVARVTRPEGDGGWSAERRQKEVATHAAAAGVALEAPAPEPAAKPLDLPTALALWALRLPGMAVLAAAAAAGVARALVHG
jgi:uncharacterized protein YceK